MPEDKLKVLHQNLVKQGYDIPDEATFRKDMEIDANRTKFHANLVKEGYDLPDYETFSGDMGFKKKVETNVQNPTDPNLSSGSKTTQPTSGLSDSPDPRGRNPKVSFLADIVSELNPNAPQLKEGQSIDDWGKELTQFAKQYPLPKEGEEWDKEASIQRMRYKLAQKKQSFEEFIDSKLPEIEGMDEKDGNLYLYRQYLLQNDPKKLKAFDEARNYQTDFQGIAAKTLLNPSEADVERMDAEFYDQALAVKQQYLNIKYEKLKAALDSPQFTQIATDREKVAAEITNLNTLAQSGQIGTEQYKIQYDQLKSQFDSLDGQIQPYVAAQEKLQDAAQKNITEAENWIKRYPLEAKRRLEEETDKAFDDAMYALTPHRRAAVNFTNQVGRGVTEFLANVVSLPQVFSFNNEYGWTDRLADVLQQWATSVNNDLFPQPEKFEKGIVNQDYSANYDLIFPKTVRTLTDMAIMASTGSAGGMVATSFAMNAKDYYDQGIQQKMSPTEASQFSIAMGSTQALLELINPETALLRKGIQRTAISDATRMLSEGVAMKDVIKETSKAIGKNVVMENVQEVSQNLGDMIGKMSANAITGSEFDFSNVGQETLETSLLTSVVSIASGGLLTSGQNTRSELEKRALFTASENPEILFDALNKAVQSGAMSPVEATKINTTVATLNQNLSALPNNVSETEKTEIVNAIYDKSRLLEVASNENLDPAIKKVYENRIKSLDAAVEKIVNKYVPKDVVETVNVETPSGTVEQQQVIVNPQEEVTTPVSEAVTQPTETVTEQVEVTQTPTQETIEPNISVNYLESGKAEAPTKENVTERLNINNPFYKKVEDALVKLGLIEKYNPKTGAGDVVGGYAQATSDGGISAGKMMFNKDGSISYFDGDVKVSFDKNGNVISENTKEVAAKNKENEIKGKKEAIVNFEKTRDSEGFKYKEVTETDPLGNRKKVRRLKTAQELKESTDKINAAIDKAKSELAALEGKITTQSEVKATELPATSEAVKEDTTTQTPTTEEMIVEGAEQTEKSTGKESTIADLNAKGKELFFEKPIRKEYEDGVTGDEKYAQDNIAHNKRVDDLILSINQNGTLLDANGVEYDVEITSQGIRISQKAQNEIKIYAKGKRVSGFTPFTNGFKFIPAPTEEIVTTEATTTPVSETVEPAQSTQNDIESQKADIERRRQEELLGKSFTKTTEKVVTGKGQSAGKTVVRFTESKISSDGEVLTIKPKVKFKNEDTSLTTTPETITVEEFREQFYENLSEQDKEMFDEFFTDDSIRIKLVEARIGLKGSVKGQVNIDVESLEGQTFGFELQNGKEINAKYDAELKALEKSNKSEQVATEQEIIELPATSEAVKEDTTTQTPTTDEKRNEEGREKRLLKEGSEGAAPIPEAPPITTKKVAEPESTNKKVFVSKDGTTIEETDMATLIVRDKKGNKVDPKTRAKILKQYRKEKLRGGKRIEAKDIEEAGVNPDEALRYVAENSTSPSQLLELMAGEGSQQEMSATDFYIAENINKISPESWNKYSDRNLLSDAIKKAYIKKDGVSVDEIAQAASYDMNPEGDGTDIDPQDVVDFILSNQQGSSGAFVATNPDAEMLRDAFIALTGATPTKAMINRALKEKGQKSNEDFAGLEPDPQEVGVASEAKEKERRFTKQVIQSSDVQGSTKAQLTKDTIYYAEQKNELSVAEANKIIADVGIDEAMRIVKDFSNNINGGVRSVLGQIIIKQLEASGRTDDALDMIDYLTKEATDAGQFIQAFSLFGALTAQGQIRYTKRELEKQRKALIEQDKTKISKTKKIVKSVVTETVDKALENVGVKKPVGIKVNPNFKAKSPTYGSKNKLVSKEQYLIDKAKLKGKLFSNPLDPAIINVAVYHLEASGYKFAQFASNLLEEFGSAVRPYIKDMYNEAAKSFPEMTIEDVTETDVADIQNEYWQDKADKTLKKLDRALKTKNEKLHNEALREILAHPDRETLWKKYRDMAASRAANFAVKQVAKDIAEKPSLEIFANELSKLVSDKLKESMPESEKGSLPQKPTVEVIADALKNPEKYKDVLEKARELVLQNEKLTDEQLFELDEYFGSMLDEPFTKKQVEKTVKEGLKSIDKKVADIARMHYTEYDATKQTLTDKLIAQADLPAAEAKVLAEAISKEFDKLITAKKSEILDRMFKDKVASKKKLKQNIEVELTKLLNLGAFNDDTILEMWAEANNYPKLTPENLKELERLASLVQEAPDGLKKFRAIEEMLKYQSTLKGVSLRDTTMAVWYANILSGYNTQLVNAVSTALNVGLNYAMYAIKNKPKNSVEVAKGIYKGFINGLHVGKYALQTGYSPILKGKVEAPATLEIKNFVGGKFNPANYLKYVRRVMVATDVLFFEAAKEMRAYQLALDMAQKEGKIDPDLDIRRRAQVILNKTDAQQEAIKENALIEYQTELERIDKLDASKDIKDALRKQADKDMRWRAFEMMQQQRGIPFVEQTSNFASRATYNYKPEGVLGQLTEGVNYVLAKVPLLRFAIPFTNIIANVANEQINYTPVGFLRAYKDGSITGNRKTPITEMEKADLYTKAAFGTAMMTMVYILANGIGDEEPWLDITADGTGDYQKNYNLADKGWQQYSFRIRYPDGTYSRYISYQYTPLQVGLSLIGNIIDGEKYKGEKSDEESVLNKLSLAFSATVGTFLDATFLSSLNDLLMIVMNPFSPNVVSNFEKSLKNSGKSLVVPNLYTQSFKKAQEINQMSNKMVTGTNFGFILKDIPIVRNIYKDQLNVLGDPVIPDTDKFTSMSKRDELAYEIKAKYLFNLRVPSIKTVVVTDPKTMETTPLSEDEYYLFTKKRGEFIKEWINKDYKEHGVEVFNVKYGSRLAENATNYAKTTIFNNRMEEMNK